MKTIAVEDDTWERLMRLKKEEKAEKGEDEEID